MSKNVQDHKPPRSKQAEEWLTEEIASQEQRYQAIIDEQTALTPEREKWYAEFLRIVSTKGFNVTGDMRRVITEEELPTKPDRDDAMKVVW
ncbi:MAG: hypothetical protein AAFZ58_10675 [Pseudomonadota bacterium]